jgi:hypothetical protein
MTCMLPLPAWALGLLLLLLLLLSPSCLGGGLLLAACCWPLQAAGCRLQAAGCRQLLLLLWRDYYPVAS